MSREEHFRLLERIYHRAPCNEYYAPKLTVSEGASEVIIGVRAEFFHAAGAVHGSVFFKALDDAAFFAVNSLIEDAFVLTVSFTVHLMRPVSEGQLRARGRVAHMAGRLFFAESTLTDSANEVVATALGTFARSKLPLSALMGSE